MSEANFINPSRLSASEQAAALDQSPAKKEKKKRKWGQDVGEIPKLIPPRKRAKTEAEKHQRALERVRRNRDAAEASRKPKHDQREMIENQRDGLQDLTRNLIDMVKELMKQCPNTHLKLEDIPGYEHLDYLLGKPEQDLMSPNELKRAKERAQVQSPDQAPGLPTPHISPISQVSHQFSSSELESSGQWTPNTEYHSLGEEKSTGSARPPQHGGLSNPANPISLFD
jgi:hypothetical protein